MPSLADSIAAYTRTPTATVYLDGARWRGVLSLRYSQAFGQGISGGSVIGRAPPSTPAIGMSIRWTWGYSGAEVAGFTGEVSDVIDFSYPDRWTLEVKDQLWRADKAQQVIETDPLNEITARAAIEYILTHYGGIPSSKLSIPDLDASGSAWAGSHWKLGILTPVAWGDTENNSGGTTALRAAQEICSCLGYWLYADTSGQVRAKQMERKPSGVAFRTFQRGVDLLLDGAPERQQSYDGIYNQVTVRGANTGVDGAQLIDQYQSSHPLLPSGVYRNYDFSSFLLEYLNPSEAGDASITSVAQRIHRVVSRVPDVVRFRAKADPRIAVGTTCGVKDSGVRLSITQNYFVYQVERTLDLQAGKFDDRYTFDGGTGSTGYTTIPPPDASFAWTLDAETMDGTAIVMVSLDGSGATSPTGEIVSWDWSTSTPTYAGTPNTASGVKAQFIFEAADSPASITLTVTDTTSKEGTITQSVDLTGADTGITPTARTMSVAAGAAWYVTPDGGATWNVETSNGDAITSNIWINEKTPGRVWFAIGDTVYRSLDGGATKTAMAKPVAGTTVHWIMEDPEVENSVFCLAGANMYHATAPTVGWVVLYAGPLGATARQFVRSRDGQVTWICYSGAPSGDAAQRVENGASADIAVDEIRTIALDKDATSAGATLWLVSAENPPAIYSVDGLTGLSAFTSSQTFPADTVVQHMVADPDHAILYCADFDSVATDQGALRKYFIDGDQLLLWKALAAGEQGHMIGFGGKAPAPITLLLIPHGASGGDDFIWKYTPGTGWSTIAPPQSGWYWQAIVASQFDNDQLLLWGNSSSDLGGGGYQMDGAWSILAHDGINRPLYRSSDGGATWTPIELKANQSKDRTDSPLWVAWSESDADLWFAGMTLDNVPNEEQEYIWRGDLTGTTFTGFSISDRSTAQDFWSLTGGIDGEVVISATTGAGNPQQFGYIARASGSFSPTSSDNDQSFASIERFAGIPRGAVCFSGDDLYASFDYRVNTPSLKIADAGFFAAAVMDGTVYVSGKGSAGVTEVTDILGSLSQTTVPITAGVTTMFIRAGRAQRTSVAARKDDDASCYIRDSNGVWSHLAGPPVSDPTKIYRFWVEVLDLQA